MRIFSSKRYKITKPIVPIWVWVAVGGAIGAISRYLVATFVQKTLAVAFPAGTMAVNVIGSFIIGLAFYYSINFWVHSPHLKALIIVGFLGAFTTFSSYSLDTVNLLMEGESLKALIYVIATNFLCFIATISGLWIARTIHNL